MGSRYLDMENLRVGDRLTNPTVIVQNHRFVLSGLVDLGTVGGHHRGSRLST